MAPPLVVTNGAQIRLAYDLNGELAFNVLGASIATPLVFNGALADTVGTAIKAAFTNQWAPHCPASVVLKRVGIRDLRFPSQPEFVDSQPDAPGTSPGAQMSVRGSAVCLTLRTASAGKSFRGRMYVPGASEGSSDSSGNWDSATILSAVAYADDIVTRLQPLGFTIGVLSRPSDDIVVRRQTSRGGTQVEDKVLFHVTEKTGQVTPVTFVESRNPRVEYQRRRDNGRGQGVSSLSSAVRGHQH